MARAVGVGHGSNIRHVCRSHSKPARRALIAIDGTWRESRQILRNSQWLSDLPRITPRDPGKTEFKIRVAPADGFISTIEALAKVLVETCDAETLKVKQSSYQSLLLAFNQMVEQQHKYSPSFEGMDNGT